MAVLVAALAFVVGAVLGAGLAVWWLGRRPVAQPSHVGTPAAIEPAPAQSPEPAAAGDPDPELKPILEATRGVVSDLEERYRGRRPGKD